MFTQVYVFERGCKDSLKKGGRKAMGQAEAEHDLYIYDCMSVCIWECM